MKTIQNRSTRITRVSVGVKATSQSGATRSVVLIELANAPTIKDRNGKTVKACVVLTELQYNTICRKAGIAPQFGSQLLVGGNLVGQYEFQRAGTEYIANENSAAVIAKEANVGDTLKREQDGYAIEIGTMPEFQLSPLKLQTLINADAYANKALDADAAANSQSAEVHIDDEQHEELEPVGAKAKTAKTAKVK